MSFKPVKVKLHSTLETNTDRYDALENKANSLGLLVINSRTFLRVKESDDDDDCEYLEVSALELADLLDQYEAEQRRATERLQEASKPDPMSRQVGGNHYAKLAIQPTEYTMRNGLGFLEGNVIKYVTRHADKDGVKDIDKAIHYLEMIKHYRYGGGEK